jgi:hypothetical protein
MVTASLALPPAKSRDMDLSLTKPVSSQFYATLRPPRVVAFLDLALAFILIGVFPQPWRTIFTLTPPILLLANVPA